MTLSEAIEAVGGMLKGYTNRKDVDNGYIGTIASLLMRYPRMVAVECTDPTRGVATKTKFIPTVADVVAWCEPEAARYQRMVHHEDLTNRQLRERAQIEQERKPPDETVIERVRREMAAAGMPIMGDGKLSHGETPEKVKARFNISDEQWAAIPDAPAATDPYWQGVRKPEAAE